MRLPDKTEIAWFAGFFDGEGCVILVPTSNHRHGRNYNMRISIGNTYLPALIRIKEMWQAGSIIPVAPRPSCKPLWTWAACSNNACTILENSLDLLYVKKSDAQFGIIFQHWKRNDINMWGRSTRPQISFEKEKMAKQLLVSCRSKDSSLVEEQLTRILDDKQRSFLI